MKLPLPSRITRRIGDRLFLKAERDIGPKSVSVRRPNPPGMHGSKRSRPLSEFGAALREKQKLRFIYGVTDAQLKRYSETASAKARGGKMKTDILLELLERRLDSVVYRLGFAGSRRIARQLVSHGHITVNGRNVRTPSIRVGAGSRIGIRDTSRLRALFVDLPKRLDSYTPPPWIRLDAATLTGEVIGEPVGNEPGGVDASRVIEFYRR